MARYSASADDRETVGCFLNRDLLTEELLRCRQYQQQELERVDVRAHDLCSSPEVESLGVGNTSPGCGQRDCRMCTRGVQTGSGQRLQAGQTLGWCVAEQQCLGLRSPLRVSCFWSQRDPDEILPGQPWRRYDRCPGRGSCSRCWSEGYYKCHPNPSESHKFVGLGTNSSFQPL